MKSIWSKVIVVLVLALGVGSFTSFAMTGNPIPRFIPWPGSWQNNNNSCQKDHSENNQGCNQFKKDKVDLKIDSQCHYYNYDPQNPAAILEGELTGYVDVGCFFDGEAFGTWTMTDLGKEKFFNFADIKPGDRGEDTVSLHVTNDACGRILISKIKDSGNTCTEPETQTDDRDCRRKEPGQKEKNGELLKKMEYKIWVDQGKTPGFQGKSDPGEGDNIFNENDHLIYDWKRLNLCQKELVITRELKEIWKKYRQICEPKNTRNINNGTLCPGITRDGYLIKDIVYYLGFAWRLPAEVGNEVQSDSVKFNLSFTAVPKEFCGHCNECGECHEKCECGC
jgi:hypothetical protein